MFLLAEVTSPAAAINWHTVFFYVTALLSCGFALTMLFSSNIVRMAFFLVISLASASGVIFLTGSHFVGAMQLMIYVGGTVVLLIFGVMLTAQEAFITMKTKAGDWVLALIVGGSLFALLTQAAFSVSAWHSTDYQANLEAEVHAFNQQVIASMQSDGRAELEVKDRKLTKVERETLSDLQKRIRHGYPELTGQIGLALVGVRTDQPSVEATGYSGYLLPFEIVSVHLLVVLVGAAYLARAKKRSAE